MKSKERKGKWKARGGGGGAYGGGGGGRDQVTIRLKKAKNKKKENKQCSEEIRKGCLRFCLFSVHGLDSGFALVLEIDYVVKRVFWYVVHLFLHLQEEEEERGRRKKNYRKKEKVYMDFCLFSIHQLRFCFYSYMEIDILVETSNLVYLKFNF